MGRGKEGSRRGGLNHLLILTAANLRKGLLKIAFFKIRI